MTNVERHKLEIRKWRKRARVAGVERDKAHSILRFLANAINELYPGTVPEDGDNGGIAVDEAIRLIIEGAANVQDKSEEVEGKD